MFNLAVIERRRANAVRLGTDAAIGVSFGAPLSADWFALLYDDPTEAQCRHNAHLADIRVLTAMRNRNN